MQTFKNNNVIEIHELKIKGVFKIVLNYFEDDRGRFMRLFDKQVFAKTEIPHNWVQENLSINSKKGIIRGLHFIKQPHTDGKLIRCSKGKVWDVVVDLRKDSKTFGNHLANTLSEDKYEWLYIPKGFAHGFCTMTEKSEIIYKHNTFYQKDFDSGIVWNDPDLSIQWPVQNPLLSEKDKALMTLKDFKLNLKGL